jgi:hypothetical protein
MDGFTIALLGVAALTLPTPAPGDCYDVTPQTPEYVIVNSPPGVGMVRDGLVFIGQLTLDRTAASFKAASWPIWSPLRWTYGKYYWEMHEGMTCLSPTLEMEQSR